MGTIWLICEDATDAETVQKILEAKSLNIRVKRIGNKVGGIFRLADELQEFIEIARSRRQKNDCIAVLHDADEHTASNREPYRKIESICQKYEKHVKRIEAKDAIEAWLLADEGLCKWLGITAKNCDGLRDPKSDLERALGKKKMKYQGKDREKVLDQLDGTGDELSPSMQIAVSHLENAPCLSEK